jgi:hypothetical protein
LVPNQALGSALSHWHSIIACLYESPKSFRLHKKLATPGSSRHIQQGTLMLSPITPTHGCQFDSKSATRLFFMHNQDARRPGAWVRLLVFENLKNDDECAMHIEGKGAIAEVCFSGR